MPLKTLEICDYELVSTTLPPDAYVKDRLIKAGFPLKWKNVFDCVNRPVEVAGTIFRTSNKHSVTIYGYNG
jgi:hypothetical protein